MHTYISDHEQSVETYWSDNILSFYFYFFFLLLLQRVPVKVRSEHSYPLLGKTVFFRYLIYQTIFDKILKAKNY